MNTRRIVAVLVGLLVAGLLIAAPILSGDDLAALEPVVDDGRIDLGQVDAVHENAHARIILLEDEQVAVVWFDPRWDGAKQRFPGHLEWQEGEGLSAFRTVNPESGEAVPWCLTSALFESEGGTFNDLGERVAGAGDRGMPRHPVSLVDGRVIVDTTVDLPGPPVDGRLGYEGARGPRCLDRES